MADSRLRGNSTREDVRSPEPMTAVGLLKWPLGHIKWNK